MDFEFFSKSKKKKIATRFCIPQDTIEELDPQVSKYYRNIAEHIQRSFLNWLINRDKTWSRSCNVVLTVHYTFEIRFENPCANEFRGIK